jgi:hypothetical protein
MTLKELSDISSALPLNAPDMLDGGAQHFAALNIYIGKLSISVARIADSPGDSLLKRDVSAFCGASILVLASIATVHGIDLGESVAAGVQELRSD